MPFQFPRVRRPIEESPRGKRQIPVRKILALICSCLSLSVTTTRADVLIYKVTESNRTIGYDVNKLGVAGGYIVFDWDSGETRMLRSTIVNGSRQFTISNPQGLRVYVAKGPNNSTYTVMSRYQEKTTPYTEILDVMYGLDVVLAIRPDRLVYSPRVLKGSPKQIVIPESDDDVVLVNSVVTGNYLGGDTQAANAASQTVDGVMERYRALYLAKGFFEVADPQ